jgi:hypothetical protein
MGVYMVFEHREGSAFLFENKKEKENQPDLKGNGMINGQVVEIAAWKKEKNGKKFLSLSIKNAGSYKKPDAPQNKDGMPF